VVLDKDSKDAIVLDVNYFSSYKGCLSGAEFFDVLLEGLDNEKKQQA